ncbi:MAG: MaoC family dehydratase [Firmicutes bacterium]|nr:MaoC family dehydratase [Bacillota bacterium]
MIVDRAFEEIRIGDKASLEKTINEEEVAGFASVVGDFNPIHLDEEYARQSRFKRRVVHGMLSVSLVSAVLGTNLPGANTIYLAQEVNFRAPVFLGDTLRAEVEVLEKREESRIIILRTTVTNQAGRMVVEGWARVMKP